MKKIISIVAKCVLLLMSGGVLGTLLLTLIFYVPVDSVNEDVTIETLYLEGDRPIANALHNQGNVFIVNFQPMMLDNGTDRVMVNTALAQGDDHLAMAMSMLDYPRYWHGYVLLLRPLLYVMNYNNLRVLNGILQLLLVLAIAMLIRDTMSRRYLWAFLTSYILLTPIALPFSLQYTWVFYLAFGGIYLVLRKREFLLSGTRYIFFFFIMGMTTVFFDLLTFPLLTWAFPLLWWLAASGEALDGRERLKKVVFSGISWVGGYGGFWLLKWCIASCILKYNVIDDAIQGIFMRVGGLTELEKNVFQAYEKWEALYCNWRYFEYGIYMVLIIVWMLWALFKSIRYGWRTRLKSGVFLLVAVSSIVWYLTLSNHTIIHAFFTHRIFVIGILGFLCFLMECVPAASVLAKRVSSEKAPQAKSWKKCLQTAAVWLLLAIAGLFLSGYAREDVTVLNGADYREVLLKEGEIFGMSFTPSFEQIISAGFCLRSTDGVGEYHIEVLQDGQSVYHMERPLSDFQEGTYHSETLYWTLHAKEEYRLQITLQGSQGENFLLMTEEDNMPLAEYRNADIDGVWMEGQLLGGFKYHAQVQSKRRRVYAALMWMMFLGAGVSLMRAAWQVYIRKSE